MDNHPGFSIWQAQPDGHGPFDSIAHFADQDQAIAYIDQFGPSSDQPIIAIDLHSGAQIHSSS